MPIECDIFITCLSTNNIIYAIKIYITIINVLDRAFLFAHWDI